MKIVVLGLSITSSWGNGHATTYRGLLRELARRGHDVLFLERDAPWYVENRDLPHPPYCQLELYNSIRELKSFIETISEADAVIIGSYVPEGTEAAEWVLKNAEGVVAFYDIDTPVTLSKLASGECNYLSRELIPEFDLYLSFTGGPTLRLIEDTYGAPSAKALYCSVDSESYFPEPREHRWDLGYLGTYSEDRQPMLNRLLIDPAVTLPNSRFAVAGPMYPKNLTWPGNVHRVTHLSPSEHRGFYNAQRFTLNITRKDMLEAGWSPSVRLFEAAACGTPMITDAWEGLVEFFQPGRDILVARSSQEVCAILRDTSEEDRAVLGENALARVLSAHTAAHRAQELEEMLLAASAPRMNETSSSFREQPSDLQELNA